VAGRRHHLFWVAACTLIVTIGGLVVANLLAFDPDDVRRRLERDLEEYKRIPEADVLKRDVFLHGLLADESYREHAKSLYREVERIHSRVHGAANHELEAKKTVPPFLARCKDLSGLSEKELLRLSDESRTHLATYATTQQAAPLREVQARLKTKIETMESLGPLEFVELQRAVRKACDGGRFQEATDLIAAFRKRPGSSDYAQQLRGLEDMVSRIAAAAVKPR